MFCDAESNWAHFPLTSITTVMISSHVLESSFQSRPPWTSLPKTPKWPPREMRSLCNACHGSMKLSPNILMSTAERTSTISIKMHRKRCALLFLSSPPLFTIVRAVFPPLPFLSLVKMQEEVTDCENNNKLCDEWARKGECKVNPEFMLTACPVSCQACPDNTQVL